MTDPECVVMFACLRGGVPLPLSPRNTHRSERETRQLCGSCVVARADRCTHTFICWGSVVGADGRKNARVGFGGRVQ